MQENCLLMFRRTTGLCHSKSQRMEQEEYLMDTNAIIDYLGKKFSSDGMKFMNDAIDNGPTLSVISKLKY